MDQENAIDIISLSDEQEYQDNGHVDEARVICCELNHHHDDTCTDVNGISSSTGCHSAVY